MIFLLGDFIGYEVTRYGLSPSCTTLLVWKIGCFCCGILSVWCWIRTAWRSDGLVFMNPLLRAMKILSNQKVENVIISYHFSIHAS